MKIEYGASISKASNYQRSFVQYMKESFNREVFEEEKNSNDLLYSDQGFFIEKNNEILFYSGYLLDIMKGYKQEDIKIESSISKYESQSLDLPDFLYKHQKKILDSIFKRKRGLIQSPTGCHTKGTKVLMYDGSFKTVEDILVGDLLMGPDGTSRKVLELKQGMGSIYKLSSNSVKTNKFRDIYINDEHILSLKHTKTNKIVNISVKDYLNKSDWFKHCHKLYVNNKALTFYNEKQVLFDPYLLGIYLGDGHSNTFSITSADKIILDYAIKYLGVPKNVIDKDNCKTIGWSLKNNSNLDYLRSLGLNITCGKNALSCSTKFVPDIYKTSCINNRLQILAGLIDSDGWLEKNYYCFVSKSKQLAEDFAFLGRSLGFYCRSKIKPNGYYLITLLGDIDRIPVKLSRKQYTKPQLRNKSVFKHGFNLEYINKDNYYGFNLDKDNLYLLEEFVITHNSGKSFVISECVCKFYEQDMRVLITVPTIDLLHQLKQDIIKYSELRDFDLKEADIGLIGGGNFDTNLNYKIHIAIPQSLCKLDKTKDVLNACTVLLADEVHTTATPTYGTIIHECINTQVRIGLSATPWTNQDNHKLLQGFFGNIICSVTEHDMIKDGVIMEPQFFFYTSPKGFVPKKIGEFACNISNLSTGHRYKILNQVYNYLILNNSGRNKKIIELALQRSTPELGPVIIIVNKVNDIGGKVGHATILKTMFEAKGKKVSIISGSIKKKDRVSIIQDLKDSKIDIVIAGPKVLTAGVNIPSLSTAILAGAGKSDSDLIQRIGRLLRKKKGKSQPLVIDFLDTQFWFENQSYTRMNIIKSVYGEKNLHVI